MAKDSKDPKDSSANKRRHFRLEYPEPDRPVFTLGKLKLQVIDLAESGMKFACDGKFKPIPTVSLSGTLTFKNGKACPVAGVVLRYDAAKDHCVVQLTQGVPYAKMVEEQLTIIRKYQKSNK